MYEKWFRYRCLCFGKRFNGKDISTTVYAPTLKTLKEKTAIDLAEKKIRETTCSRIDRGKIELTEKGGVTWKELLTKNVIDNEKFDDDVFSSKVYKKLFVE